MFLEYYQYSRGLEAHFLGEEGRPAWLPSSDSVGLHNEVELASGEYVVELARVANAEHRITWIGCFTHAVDKVHGDRGNYCGVGVWLVDAWPLYATHIVNALFRLCGLLTEGNSAASLEAELNKFRVKYLGSYVRNLELLPRAMSTMPFSTGVPRTKYFRLRRDDALDKRFESVGRSILELCVAAPANFDAGRILYLLTSDRAFRTLGDEVALLPDDRDQWPKVLDSLLGTYASSTGAINKLEDQNQAHLKMLRERTQSIDALKTEVLVQQRAAGERSATIDQLRAEKQRLEREVGELRAPYDGVDRRAPPVDSYHTRATVESRDLLAKMNGMAKEVESLRTEWTRSRREAKPKTPSTVKWALGVGAGVLFMAFVTSISTFFELLALRQSLSPPAQTVTQDTPVPQSQEIQPGKESHGWSALDVK